MASELSTFALETAWFGTINSRIINGSIINEVANAVFKQNLQEKVTYDLNIDTNLVPNQAVSSANVESSLANLTVKKAIYDFKEGSLKSDYLLNIESLEKLKDITKVNLIGKMDVIGEIFSKNGSLEVNGKSNTLGGNLDFNSKNEKLNADFKNIDVQELSNMLNYSKFFDAKANITLNYDSLLKKGDFNAKLSNGHFLENSFTTLYNQLTKDDLSKEVFETFDINSKIEDRVLTSNLNMKGLNSQVAIENATLDLEKNLVDAKINAKVKESNLNITLNGEASNPKISADVKELLKEKIIKQLEKKKNKTK